ncbi:MAG: hypothetical protein ACREUG_01270, partial [Steroidobacteraceae bacterium]
YATGLTTLALEENGVSAANPRLSRALAWLRSNQDSNGDWSGYSLNRRHGPGDPTAGFMNDAATAFAVLALTQASEIESGRRSGRAARVDGQHRAGDAPRLLSQQELHGLRDIVGIR